MNMFSDAAVVISLLNCAYLITVERKKSEQGLTSNYTMRASRISLPIVSAEDERLLSASKHEIHAESNEPLFHMWEKYASTMTHHMREKT